jgi:CBS domain-containing protein
MKVSDLQHHELSTAQADESLDVAADRMNWHQVGALPVLEGQRLVGIITERDITAAMAEGADPVVDRVSDYMTPAPEVLQPDSELADAAHLMLELGIRHLPIVQGGRLVGVLSIRDVLDADTHRAEKTARGTAKQETVRSVAEPSAAHARCPDGGMRLCT